MAIKSLMRWSFFIIYHILRIFYVFLIGVAIFGMHSSSSTSGPVSILNTVGPSVSRIIWPDKKRNANFVSYTHESRNLNQFLLCRSWEPCAQEKGTPSAGVCVCGIYAVSRCVPFVISLMDRTQTTAKRWEKVQLTAFVTFSNMKPSARFSYNFVTFSMHKMQLLSHHCSNMNSFIILICLLHRLRYITCN